jgi:hypothetical protein
MYISSSYCVGIISVKPTLMPTYENSKPMQLRKVSIKYLRIENLALEDYFFARNDTQSFLFKEIANIYKEET